jgi:hypothetical protein
MTTNDLAALVLPWAKAHAPDLYDLTLARAARPLPFRKCLVRLVEVRYAREPAWRAEAPLAALELTALALDFRTKDGDTFTVAGAGVPDRALGFALLADVLTTDDPKATLRVLLDATRQLDLALIDTESP